MNAMPLSGTGDEQDVAQAGYAQENDLSADDGFRSEFPDYSYDPFAEPFVPSAPITAPVSVSANQDRIEPDERDSHWSWHDAALVGVKRTNASGDVQYEVGCVDLYANTQSGDLGGNYLRLDSFADVDAAAGYYRTDSSFCSKDVTQVNERKSEMMSAKKVGILAVKTDEQSSKLIDPSKTTFTGEALLVDGGIEQPFPSTLDGFSVALVLADIGNDVVVETDFASLKRIKSAVSVEIGSDN